jgi:cupin
MTPPIPIFHNELNALGDFEGGVKVASDFAAFRLYWHGSLSDMLSILTVERAAQVRFEGQGSYAMRFGGVDHIKFGAVLSGSVCLWVDGDAEPLGLEAGDCYLLTDGRPYGAIGANMRSFGTCTGGRAI